jgi:3-(3-hydroxy-phenyl)propionate hydroxylase
VLQNTRAQTILGAPGDHMTALRETMAELIGLEQANARLAGMLTALDVRYDVGGDGHPLLGLRVPDADIKTEDATRVHELLRPGRPVLLDLGADLREAAAGWADRVDVVTAECADEPWLLPPMGEVAAPRALLIRPDGHVAWAAGDGPADAEALRTALGRWFGAASN